METALTWAAWCFVGSMALAVLLCFALGIFAIYAKMKEGDGDASE